MFEFEPQKIPKDKGLVAVRTGGKSRNFGADYEKMEQQNRELRSKMKVLVDKIEEYRILSVVVKGWWRCGTPLFIYRKIDFRASFNL